MSKERTVLLRTTSFSVQTGEAAVGARPATVASDENRYCRYVLATDRAASSTGIIGGRRAWTASMMELVGSKAPADAGPFGHAAKLGADGGT